MRALDSILRAVVGSGSCASYRCFPHILCPHIAGGIERTCPSGLPPSADSVASCAISYAAAAPATLLVSAVADAVFYVTPPSFLSILAMTNQTVTLTFTDATTAAFAVPDGIVTLGSGIYPKPFLNTSLLCMCYKEALCLCHVMLCRAWTERGCARTCRPDARIVVHAGPLVHHCAAHGRIGVPHDPHLPRGGHLRAAGRQERHADVLHGRVHGAGRAPHLADPVALQPVAV